ncbi:MAG: HEPN domain-containing protein [Acidobacteriota bacterium]
MKEHTAKLLAKAGGAIQVAEDPLQLGHVEHAAGRAYYAMFYSAEALLYEKDLRSRRRGSFCAKPSGF